MLGDLWDVEEWSLTWSPSTNSLLQYLDSLKALRAVCVCVCVCVCVWRVVPKEDVREG